MHGEVLHAGDLWGLVKLAQRAAEEGQGDELLKGDEVAQLLPRELEQLLHLVIPNKVPELLS